MVADEAFHACRMSESFTRFMGKFEASRPTSQLPTGPSTDGLRNDIERSSYEHGNKGTGYVLVSPCPEDCGR